MADVGGGRIAGAPVDRAVAPIERRRLVLPLVALDRVAGFAIPAAEAAARLAAIDIATEVTADALVATVPTFRPDVVIEEDLAEEVMRLVGYDRVPARLPLSGAGRAPRSSPERLADRARDALAALGLHEIAAWAFVPRPALAALGDPALAEGIALRNPISADYEVMRTSLLPGLADAAARNLRRGVADVGLFEVGPVILPAPGAEHHRQLTFAAALLAGRRPGWLKPGEPLDFFDVKRIAVELLAALGVPAPRFTTASDGAAAAPYLHPGLSAEIRAGGSDGSPPLGRAGALHPAAARRLGLEVPAYYCEIQLDPLEERAAPAAGILPPPRFPAVTRDVSFWIGAAVPAEAQREAMVSAAEPLLRELAVLEDFRDERHCPPGQKGMLWTMAYRADDRTLTDAEADAAHARVVGALGKTLPIRIR
jgi:phenylalanyl-tRNA synthetase beta chain